MVLNNVQCRGSETVLLDCPVGLQIYCTSSTARAGVTCYPRTGIYVIFFKWMGGGQQHQILVVVCGKIQLESN